MPVTINGSDGITNASWTTGTRPSNPAAGQMGYNTDLGFIEVYDGNNDEWVSSGFLAEGGTVTTITDGGLNYKVHTFTSSGTFNVISGSKEVEYLVVAGGGGGGVGNTGNNCGGGGGGAGGYVSGVKNEVSGGGCSVLSTVTGLIGSYNIIVGAGGSEGTPFVDRGGSGGDSSAFGITAIGGGGGAGRDHESGSGGSAGGGSCTGLIGDATSCQGFATSSSGGTPAGATYGGGGAGGPGDVGSDGTGGDGGEGVESTINGTPTHRAGGGGGGRGGSAGGGDGGLGGGGDGADDEAADGSNGQSNTGGGGGGGGGFADSETRGGSGGSGIVIIRYQI